MVWLREDEAPVPRKSQVWAQVSDRRCWGLREALEAARPALETRLPWTAGGFRVSRVDRRGSGSAAVLLEATAKLDGETVLREATVALEWCL